MSDNNQHEQCVQHEEATQPELKNNQRSKSLVECNELSPKKTAESKKISINKITYIFNKTNILLVKLYSITESQCTHNTPL